MSNALPAAAATSLPDPREVEQFIYREARLLDERRFEEWRDLFTEDGYYWAPTDHAQASPDERVSLFYDTRATMAARISRLAHPDVHVQVPPSHTAHLVSNIELDPTPQPDGALRVHAAFFMGEYRHTEPRWYAGRYEYALQRVDGALRIARKKVVLVDCDAAFTAMAIYL
jgi:benzoate/toluate 1,2-dioxygenase beta subunit